MKRKLKKLVLIFSIIFLISSTIVYANTSTEEKIKIDMSKLLLEIQNKQSSDVLAGYSISVKESMKRSVYNNLTDSEETTGSSYDLRKVLDKIQVKNQRKVGACWAVSYSSVLETTMANKYNRPELEYSPIHMEYMASEMYNKKLGAGGTKLMALAYSAGGYGPVYESDLPFESVYDEEKNSYASHYLSENVTLDQIAKARIKEATLYATIYKEYGENEIIYRNGSETGEVYSEEEIQATREIIKQQIRENGAVSAILYSDMGTVASGSYVSRNGYYDSENNYFYCDNNSVRVNHAVTIIGWDDNIKKEDFKTANQPLHDGAYIALNSWGEQFGENGYFYISYDDAWIERELMGVQEIKEKDEFVLEHIYQHDELGANIRIPLTLGGETLTEIEAANVFTRENAAEEEYLTEVGIFLLSTHGIEVYVNTESDDLNEMTLVATATGSNALESGYHTLKLPAPLKLTGDKFAVKVKYINSETAWLPIETNASANGLVDDEKFYTTATSNEGESYILSGTKWVDMTKLLVDSNACIKAFTYVDIAVENVELDKEAIVIEEGKTSNLIATITPKYATNRNIIWTSSDENIATVDNGVVSGISEGTTTITVKTADGDFTDSCVVTVEKPVIRVTGIELDKETVVITEGETSKLEATLLPENADNKNVIWESSDENIVTISEGIIKGISEGTAIITVKTEDGEFTDTCIVTVEKKVVHVTGVKLDKETLTLKEGENSSLEVILLSENATNKNIIWTSSDENVAIVDNGIIKGISKGTATITVTTEDGKLSDTCLVTVEKEKNEITKPEEPIPEPPKEPELDPEPESIRVKGIELNKTELSMQVGDKTNLVSTIDPLNATNKKVVWASSNEKAATITEQGIITAKSKGTTIITVTTEDGEFNAKCTLTVIEKTNVADDIYISQDTSDSKKDETIADIILPDAGNKFGMIIMIATILGVTIIFIKYRTYKDIK